MIFVTVGTHEQQFNRLVKYMDNLKKDEKIKEDVVIQTGFCTYEPQFCKWRKLFSYQEMIDMVNEARIVITHGGPSSFIMPLQIGKTPIVVPRMSKFNEHVNDHQVEFCNAVAKRAGTIIVVEDIENLENTIKSYSETVSYMPTGIQSNNSKFCVDFEKLVEGILR